MASDFLSVINPTDPSRREQGGSQGRVLPILPVRSTVLFPHAVLPLTVGRESSIQLIQSLGEQKTIVVVAQRDERMGWLNDLTVRTEESVYNFQMARFYSKFLNDIADAQAEDGTIPDTAPFRWGERPADPQLPRLMRLAVAAILGQA